jgi:hypothetical protein
MPDQFANRRIGGFAKFAYCALAAWISITQRVNVLNKLHLKIDEARLDFRINGRYKRGGKQICQL